MIVYIVCDVIGPLLLVLDNEVVEIVELPQTKHPYFIAGQFHPEFKSRPTTPHPLFVGLVTAALKGKTK